MMLFRPTTAGSLPKPGWLAETEKLWPKWKLEGAELDQAKRDAALIWIKLQEDAGIEIVNDGEQFRTHFVHGFQETVHEMGAELLALLLPILRADVRLVETYRSPARPPLEVEIVALGGADDPAISAAKLAGWRTHTTGKFSARLLPGGHFFLFRGDGPQPTGGNPAAVSPALRLVIDRLSTLASTAK